MVLRIVLRDHGHDRLSYTILSRFTRRPVVSFDEISSAPNQVLIVDYGPRDRIVQLRGVCSTLFDPSGHCVCDVSPVCSYPRVASTPQKIPSGVLVHMRTLRSSFGLDICLVLRYKTLCGGEVGLGAGPIAAQPYRNCPLSRCVVGLVPIALQAGQAPRP